MIFLTDKYGKIIETDLESGVLSPRLIAKEALRLLKDTLAFNQFRTTIVDKFGNEIMHTEEVSSIKIRNPVKFCVKGETDDGKNHS